jgi:hypothetical protein
MLITIPACAPPLVEGCGQTTRHVTAQIPRRIARCQRRPPTATSPLKGPAYATSQSPTTHIRYLITQNHRVRHVMDDDDPPHATSQPMTSAPAKSPPPTTPGAQIDGLERGG